MTVRRRNRGIRTNRATGPRPPDDRSTSVRSPTRMAKPRTSGHGAGRPILSEKRTTAEYLPGRPRLPTFRTSAGTSRTASTTRPFGWNPLAPRITPRPTANPPMATPATAATTDTTRSATCTTTCLPLSGASCARSALQQAHASAKAAERRPRHLSFYRCCQSHRHRARQVPGRSDCVPVARGHRRKCSAPV